MSSNAKLCGCFVYFYNYNHRYRKKQLLDNSMDFCLVHPKVARRLRFISAASFVAFVPRRSYSMNHRLELIDTARNLRSMFAASFVDPL